MIHRFVIKKLKFYHQQALSLPICSASSIMFLHCVISMAHFKNIIITKINLKLRYFAKSPSTKAGA